MGGGDRGIIILNKPVSVGVYASGGRIVCVWESECVYALPHASLLDENERSPLQALYASKDTKNEGTIFAQAQLWVRDWVYATVCVCTWENVWRLMREIYEKQQGIKREREKQERV